MFIIGLFYCTTRAVSLNNCKVFGVFAFFGLFVYSRKRLALVLANLLADRSKIVFSKSSYFNNFFTSKFLREKNL